VRPSPWPACSSCKNERAERCQIAELGACLPRQGDDGDTDEIDFEADEMARR
jgi:hypothetical protein